MLVKFRLYVQGDVVTFQFRVRHDVVEALVTGSYTVLYFFCTTRYGQVVGQRPGILVEVLEVVFAGSDIRAAYAIKLHYVFAV